MSPEKQQSLISTFPKLYRETSPEYRSSMNSGLSIGDGWYELVFQLSKDLESAAKSEKLDPDTDQWPAATQVKSKFGSLRFYCRTGNKKEQNYVYESFGEVISYRPFPTSSLLAELIKKAETSSKSICEECGKPGSMRATDWIKTLCEVCFSRN
jgi:hypothetical protein